MRFLAICFIWLVWATSALSAEFIKQFDAQLSLTKDGTLRVTETIDVVSEGRSIKRGIYRVIPMRFEDTSGKIRNNAFELISVTRDGQPDGVQHTSKGGFHHIRIGYPDVFLRNGDHRYVITYETSRQIRFFDNYAELYWNVNGTEWEFPIRLVSAKITLPEGIAVDLTTFATGRLGDQGKDATAQISQSGSSAIFRSTRTFKPRENLTIGVKFAKDAFPQPSALENALTDNRASIIAFLGLIFVSLSYVWAWNRVGRDPPRDIIVPRWDLPDSISPALVNYIDEKGIEGHGWTAISSAALSLAVKGVIEIVDIGNETGLKRVSAWQNSSDLPVGEAALLGQIDKANGYLALTKANGKAVQLLASKFSSAMEKEHHSVYYKHNSSWLVLGVVASVITIVAAFASVGFPSEIVPFLGPVIFMGVALAKLVGTIGKFMRNKSFNGKIATVIFSAFLSCAAIGFVFNAADFKEFSLPQPILFTILFAIVLINGLFYFLMGAPTPIGQKRSAEIAGLKRYLTVAEADRMNMQGAPEMSPQHFEKLLPFAVALGVEKPWSKAFQGWLAAAVAAGAASAVSYYGPRWYSGQGDFSPSDIGGSIGGISSSMAKSFASSMPAPKSSSSGFSGGGGSSGGGGGGGGGGGW